MGDNVLIKRVEDNIAYLIMNRPDQYNALNKALFLALKSEIYSLDEDKEVKVIILTGAGDKAFCAGIDLKERAGMPKDEIMPYRESVIRPCYEALRRCSKPMIAAVNGIAYGGGAELALVCDIRIASQNAKFAQSEIRWGMIPACGACQRLRMIVGIGIAKEIIFTGRTLDAKEAYRLHIFNRVVSPESLMDEARKMALDISKHSGVALRQAKRVIDIGAGISESLDYEFEASKECYFMGEAIDRPKRF